MNSRKASLAVAKHDRVALAALRSIHVPPEGVRFGARRTIVYLARGHLLRIFDGRAMRVTAASGLLWVTEEGDVNDTVLREGETRRIRHSGMTLVVAERPAHIVLEARAAVFLPSHVEIATGDGEPGTIMKCVWKLPDTIWSPLLAAGCRIRSALS